MADEATDLALLCSEEWLRTPQLDILATILNDDLASAVEPGVIQLTAFMQKLINKYRQNRDDYDHDKSVDFVRDLASKMLTLEVPAIGAAVAVHFTGNGAVLPNAREGIISNHWCSLVIDTERRTWFYGDPLGCPPPSELTEILDWWFEVSFRAIFIQLPLPTAQQVDAISCSILSMNALAHHFLRERQLLSDAPSCLQARVETLVSAVKLMKKLDPGLQASGDKTIGKVSMSTFQKNSVSNQAGKTKKEKSVTQKGKAKPPAPPKQMKLEDNTSFFFTSKESQKDDAGSEESGTDEDDDEWADDTDDTKVWTDERNVIDVPVVKPTGKRKKGGRPASKLLNRLLRRCYRTSEPWKVIYRCVGSCGTLYSNRNTARAVRHANECPEVPEDVRAAAKAHLIAQAPSQQLSATAPSLQSDAVQAEPAVAHSKSAKGEGKVKAVKKMKSETGHPWFKDVQNLGRRERHNRLDLVGVKFFCCTGIPTYISSLDVWRELLITADPSYTPPTRAKLEEVLIPAEAELILQEQIKILQKAEDITVSCDGGTSRGRESFWTVHMSTPEMMGGRRKVYLMETREATSKSHTAEWIKTLVLGVIDKVGRSRIGAVVCDSTGNTRLFRELLVKEIPTVFNLPDIVHFISNMIKDIAKLDHFKSTITTMRAVIKKFHKSHPGITELEIAHDLCRITKGLDAIGKTRFGTLVLAAWSVQLNLPALKKVVERNVFDLEDLADYFVPATTANFQFEKILGQLIKVGSPALKALTCLESNDATVGDVYIFWHATMWAIKEELARPRCEIPSDVQEKIIGILNARHDQLFTKGKLATASELYLAGAYLNPVYLKSDLFSKDGAPENQEIDYSGISHFSTFKRVMLFLLQSSASEIMQGHKEALTKWKGHATDFKNQLLKELKMYARQQFPFNTVVDDDKAIIAWWQALKNHESAQILPILAIKIFSVRANSMAEERTVSAFTWITPALRSRLSVGQMAARTVVRQYYSTEAKVFQLARARGNNVTYFHDLKARKHSTPRPTIKFYDVKSKIFRTAGETPESEKVLDEEDDSWLDDSPDSSDSAYEPAKMLKADATDPSKNAINLRSKYLSTFLASEKEAESKKDGDEKISSATRGRHVDNDGEDNDFSMDFDD